ncbi:hypothetical protein Bca4012_087019 [Brassica carinata]
MWCMVQRERTSESDVNTTVDRHRFNSPPVTLKPPKHNYLRISHYPFQKDPHFPSSTCYCFTAIQSSIPSLFTLFQGKDLI